MQFLWQGSAVRAQPLTLDDSDEPDVQAEPCSPKDAGRPEVALQDVHPLSDPAIFSPGVIPEVVVGINGHSAKGLGNRIQGPGARDSKIITDPNPEPELLIPTP